MDVYQVHEMQTIDLIKRKNQKFNPIGLYDLRKESSKQFYGRWAWRPHDIATPSSFRLQKAEYYDVLLVFVLVLFFSECLHFMNVKTTNTIFMT